MELFLEKHMYTTHAVAAAASTTFGTAVTYPLDTVKTLIQVGSGPGKRLTPTQALETIRAFSGGNSGLYSGFHWLALGRTFGLGARFCVYELLTAFNKDGREDNYVYVNEALIAGFAAGATESLMSSPFELIKVRSQVTSASRVPPSTPKIRQTAASPFIDRLLRGYSPNKSILSDYVSLLSTLNSKCPNMVGAIRDYPWMISGSGKPPSVCDVKRPLDVVSLEGWKALWRGFRSGVARDATFGGIFFSTWQFLHQAMLDWKAVGMNPPPSTNEEVGPLSPVAVSLAAGFSGAVAAAGSHCFDTAKSRSQCTVIPKYVAMERKLLKWSRPGNRFERYTGIHPADRNLLFHGMWPRIARSGVSSFLIVGGYYLFIDQLVSG